MQKTALLLVLIASICLQSCNNYGKKVQKGHIEVFYKDNVTQEQAEKAAAVLMLIEKAAGREEGDLKSFQISMKPDGLNLAMVANAEKSKSIPDAAFLDIVRIIADSAFPGRTVSIDLTDNKFISFKHIPFTKDTDYNGDSPGYGKKYTSGKVDLYVKKDMSENEAQKFADYLNNLMQPGQVINFQLLNDKTFTLTLNMIIAEDKLRNFTDENFKGVAEKISREGLHGQKLVFQLTDAEFKPFMSITTGNN